MPSRGSLLYVFVLFAIATLVAKITGVHWLAGALVGTWFAYMVLDIATLRFRRKRRLRKYYLTHPEQAAGLTGHKRESE
jgi:multisubunit Na+/H+ antiporter MnhE subunit